MKKYLRVTSKEHSVYASPPSLPKLQPLKEGPDDDEEFNTFHLWAQLLSELFEIFNWYEGALDPEMRQGMVRNVKGTSIFTGTEAKETVKVSLAL